MSDLLIALVLLLLNHKWTSWKESKENAVTFISATMSIFLQRVNLDDESSQRASPVPKKVN